MKMIGDHRQVFYLKNTDLFFLPQNSHYSTDFSSYASEGPFH